MGTRTDFGWYAYDPLSAETAYGVTIQARAVSTYDATLTGPVQRPLGDWPWAVLVIATLVGTVAWYAWRARGAGGSVRTHVALAIGGGLAVPACYVVAGAADATDDTAGVVTSVGLPMLGLGALAGAWAYLGKGAWRRTAVTLGVACLVTGVATLLGAWSPGLFEPALVAAGLLALAWYERSRLVAVVACAVLVALVVSPDGTLSMLIPAGIVLAAAIAALVRRNDAAAPA